MLCTFDGASFIVLFIEIFNFSYLYSTRKWCYSSCDIYKKKCINIFDQAWRRIPKRFVELVRYIEDSVFACDRVDKNIKKWGWYFACCIRLIIRIWYEATSPAIVILTPMYQFALIKNNWNLYYSILMCNNKHTVI